MAKKNELGKGLRALLSNIEENSTPKEKEIIVRELSNSISNIRLEDIETNPFQPRVEFDTEELLELAKSIKVHGLIQPITVRSLGGSKFQLISGERRLRASKMAGIKEIPCFIRIANDQEMLEMALIENIQRAELNAIEIAISYQRLLDECQLTHEGLSERVGKNRSTITNYIRLLKLPPEVQNGIKSGKISMGHARVLAGINSIDQQLNLYKKCIEEQWSVRTLEQKANESNQATKDKVKKVVAYIHPEIAKIEKELSGIFGRKITINRKSNGSGKMVISFKNDDDFNYIYDLLTNRNT